MNFNFRIAREQNNLSQDDVAKYLNVTQSLVSKWEKGTSSINPITLCKLADLYHVSVDYLLGRESNNNFVSENTGIAILGNNVVNGDISSYKQLDQYEQALLENYRELDMLNRSKLLTISFELKSQFKSKQKSAPEGADK